MPGTRFLAGHGMELRTIEPEDRETVERWRNHPDVRRYIHEFRYPYSAADEWTTRDRDPSDRVDLLACVDETPVGRVRLTPLRQDRRYANLGFLIAPDHQGEGYATAAADLLLTYAFAELRLHRLEARALAPNEGSRHVIEKLGFEREGRRRDVAIVDGEFVDEVCYGLLRPQWETDD